MLKKSHRKKSRGIGRGSGVPARFVSSTAYYRAQILGSYEHPECKHPDDEIWLRNEIISLCGKRLSTAAVPFLEKLYAGTPDAYCRKLLARRIYMLRQDYLNSFKEYSDSRLLMLVEGRAGAEKWEGIFILGTFGGYDALQRLQEMVESEEDALFKHVLLSAVRRIETRLNKQKHDVSA